MKLPLRVDVNLKLSDVAEAMGTRVVTLDLVEGLSTTNIINKVLEAHTRK